MYIAVCTRSISVEEEKEIAWKVITNGTADRRSSCFMKLTFECSDAVVKRRNQRKRSLN